MPQTNIDPNDPTKSPVNDPAGDPNLPPEETPSEENPETTPAEPAAPSARERELEIEKARLEGENNALKKLNAPAVGGASSQEEQWKQRVLADVNSMPDEDFKTKYNCEKHQATSAVIAYDQSKTDQRVSQLQAENRLMSQYGADFNKFQGDIDAAVADASPEVRKDPVRLAKVMERALLAARSGAPAPAAPRAPANPGGNPVDRKRITNFDKPNDPSPAPRGTQTAADEVPSEFREVGRHFKITSEKERQDLMKDDFVEIDFGGGVKFRDPKDGFIEKAVA